MFPHSAAHSAPLCSFFSLPFHACHLHFTLRAFTTHQKWAKECRLSRRKFHWRLPDCLICSTGWGVSQRKCMQMEKISMRWLADRDSRRGRVLKSTKKYYLNDNLLLCLLSNVILYSSLAPGYCIMYVKHIPRILFLAESFKTCISGFEKSSKGSIKDP